MGPHIHFVGKQRLLSSPDLHKTLPFVVQAQPGTQIEERPQINLYLLQEFAQAPCSPPSLCQSEKQEQQDGRDTPQVGITNPFLVVPS